MKAAWFMLLCMAVIQDMIINFMEMSLFFGLQNLLTHNFFNVHYAFSTIALHFFHVCVVITIFSDFIIKFCDSRLVPNAYFQKIIDKVAPKTPVKWQLFR